jgi:predicted GNAT family N-acyltransferase
VTLCNPSKSEACAGNHIRAWVAPWRDARSAVYAIRQEVFVEEQRLTNSVYDDPDDELSVHVLAAVDGEIVGVGRATYIFDEAQIAWVAVRRLMRRHGVGQAIMHRLIGASLEHGVAVISLNAQTHALSFYEQLGFRPVGRKFHMGGIEHQHMIMEIESQPTL